MTSVLVEHRPIGIVVDREALSVWTNRSPETIRRLCPVQEYHRDGRALYVADQCVPMLEDRHHVNGRTGVRLQEEQLTR